MLYTETRICPGKLDKQNSLILWQWKLWIPQALGEYLYLEIPLRRSNQVVVNKIKKTCELVDFAFPAKHKANVKESKKLDKYLDLARVLKHLWNKDDCYITHCWCYWFNLEVSWGKSLVKLKIWGRIETIPTTAENGLNTFKDSGELERLPVTRTSMKTPSYYWCEKLTKEIMIIMIIVLNKKHKNYLRANS